MKYAHTSHNTRYTLRHGLPDLAFASPALIRAGKPVVYLEHYAT